MTKAKYNWVQYGARCPKHKTEVVMRLDKGFWCKAYKHIPKGIEIGTVKKRAAGAEERSANAE